MKNHPETYTASYDLDGQETIGDIHFCDATLEGLIDQLIAAEVNDYHCEIHEWSDPANYIDSDIENLGRLMDFEYYKTKCAAIGWV